MLSTGIFRPPFTSKLDLLFEISGTENTGSYKRRLLPAETRGTIAPVRENLTRISNKSVSLKVKGGLDLPVAVLERAKGGFLSLFEQVLHGAAKDLGDAIRRLSAGLVDVFVSPLVHLDGARADAGAFCELGLGAAIGRDCITVVIVLPVVPQGCALPAAVRAGGFHPSDVCHARHTRRKTAPEQGLFPNDLPAFRRNAVRRAAPEPAGGMPLPAIQRLLASPRCRRRSRRSRRVPVPAGRICTSMTSAVPAVTRAWVLPL